MQICTYELFVLFYNLSADRYPFSTGNRSYSLSSSVSCNLTEPRCLHNPVLVPKWKLPPGCQPFLTNKIVSFTEILEFLA